MIVMDPLIGLVAWIGRKKGHETWVWRGGFRSGVVVLLAHTRWEAIRDRQKL